MTTKFIDNYVLFEIENNDKISDLSIHFKSNKYFNLNVIINLKSIAIIQYLDFLNTLSIKHKTVNKSFVVISCQINEDLHGLELSLVPTIDDALDLIQLEDIERDLNMI